MTYAVIGVSFQGLGADGGTGGFADRNRVYNLSIGANHDSFSSRDMVYSYNYYSGVTFGPYQNMGGEVPGFLDEGVPCSLTNSNDVGTVTVAGGHRFLPGDAIRVQNVLNAASQAITEFIGYFEVIEVPSSPTNNGLPTTLKYRMSQTPSAPVANNGTGNPPRYREFSRVRHLEIERNLIELTAGLRADYGSYGVALSGKIEDAQHNALPNIYRRVVCRENMTRALKNADPYAVGVLVASAEMAISQFNIADLVGSDTRVVVDYRVDKISCLNNQRSSGIRVQGWDELHLKKRDELFTRIEDALMLGI